MKKSSLLLTEFRTALVSKKFLEKHRASPVSFTRTRTLTFGKIVGTLLQKVCKSLQIECNFLGELLSEASVSKQAFSKARYKVGVSTFQDLHQRGKKIYFTDNQDMLWKGYRVFGGDGSTLALPREGDLSQFFGDHFEHRCLARIFQYTELLSGLVVSGEISPYKVSENSMAHSHLESLTKEMVSLGQEKQIYIYDRGFPSHEFAFRHIQLDVDFVFRLPIKFNPTIDEFVADKKEIDCDLEFDRGDFKYTGRVVIRYLSSGKPLMLLTSLRDRSNFDSEEIVKLYSLRWRCEEAYKFQKLTLQLENFSGRTTHAVFQEFWSTIVLAFTMGVLCNEQEEEEKTNPRLAKSKINRSVVFASLKPKLWAYLLFEISYEELYGEFKRLSMKHRVKIRPGRSYPRTSDDIRRGRHIYQRCV